MKSEELILNYVNSSQKPREAGRYWATDVFPIIRGFLVPQNFFKFKEIDLEGAFNILSGEAYEAKWKEVLAFNGVKFKYGDETKREIVIGDIVLVVKPDFEFEDWVLETKFPVKKPFLSRIPEKWIYQLECEYRATNKKVVLGVFSHPFSITFYHFTPSEERWEKIKKALLDFDKKLKRWLQKHPLGI